MDKSELIFEDFNITDNGDAEHEEKKMCKDRGAADVINHLMELIFARV